MNNLTCDLGVPMGSPISRRSFAAMCLAATAAPALAVSSTTGLIDLMPSFWRAYDAAPSANRADYLFEAFFEPRSAIFDGAGVVATRSAIGTWLPDFERRSSSVRHLSREFPIAYQRHIAKFKKSFPRFDPVAAPVYVMLSLNGFDGHLQEWNGKVPLFFGLDGIVHFHGDNPDLSVLLDHESFHLVQVQEQPDLIALDPAPLWTQLWREGSATFVSAALNPKATRERVLLDSRDLATAPPSAIARLAGQFLQHFDSTDRDLVRKYFSARYKGSDPARSGYLLGLEACRVVAQNLTLTRFAELSVTDTYQKMRDALEQLAVAP